MASAHPVQKKILVVEDELFVRLMAVDMLDDAGYVVQEAGNADEALTLLEAHDDFDLVFTDIKMPGSIDGIGLARTISERWPAIPVLITSGHVVLPDTIGSLKSAFLPKPYRANALIAQIGELAS